MNRIPIASVTLAAILSGCAAHRPMDADSAQTKPLADANQKPVTLAKSPAPVPPLLAQVGRYSAVTATPTEEQTHLLRVMVSVTFPGEVATIRQAVMHLLRRSGYRLAEPGEQSMTVVDLLYKPLPQVHRHLGPMRLEDALRTLTGPAYDLTVDPVNRVVSYELAEEYRPLPQYTVAAESAGGAR